MKRYLKKLKSFADDPLKMELKSPVIVKECVLLSLQIRSNGGVNDGN